MSGREWKPGDVAVSMVRDVPHIIFRIEDRGVDRWCDKFGPLGDESMWPAGREAIRPLVVIDPEDREQVERLLTSLQDMSFAAHACGAFTCLQTALREFANPTPPKPEEPTGLGAVVEDAECHRWTRANTAGEWFCECGDEVETSWGDVKAVRILSEGVPS